jgi:hypothetical protein
MRGRIQIATLITLLIAPLIATALLSAACDRTIEGRAAALAPANLDQPLIVDYFERSNAAARKGPAAQRQFLEQTQHPDVDQRCDLGGLTILLDPSLSTLRSDDGWRPATTDQPPRGRVYVIAVTVTVQRDATTVGVQIGSMHLVVLDGAVYGFAPCPE